MLSKEVKEFLNGFVMSVKQAHENYLQYPEAIGTWEVSLAKAKEVFEDFLDEGKGDSWFEENLRDLNKGVTKPKRKQKPRAEFALSERGANKTLTPITKKAGKDLTFPIELTIDDKRYITNSYWGARNFAMMDMLSYLILQKAGFPKKRITLFNSLEEIERREKEIEEEGQESEEEHEELDMEHGKLDKLKNPMTEEKLLGYLKNVKYWVGFGTDFFRRFTGKENAEAKEVLDLLLQTSAKFVISYPVRLPVDEKGKIQEKKYTNKIFTSFFNVAWIDEKDKDGRVKHRTFYAFFNTILGEIFVNNLLSKGYDIIGTQLYQLPSLAQMFFRRFIVHHSHYGSQVIGLQRIKEGLNLTDENKAQVLNYIKSGALEPLKKAGAISYYEIRKGINGTEIVIQRSDRKYLIYQRRLESKRKKRKSKQYHGGEVEE